jgi:hypothetical protein
VRLSDSTYALLTNVDGFEPCAPIETLAFGTIRTWSRAVVPPAAEIGRPTRDPIDSPQGGVNVHV